MEKRYPLVILAILVFVTVYFTDIGIPDQPRHVLAIVLFAAVLWFSEALPLHVTGLFAAFMLATAGGLTPKEVFPPFFDPIIALLLGGFVLALGLQKHGLDEFLAKRFLSLIGNSPRRVLLGMMLMSAFLSMWITNTASTIIMLALAISILKDSGLKPMKSPYAKALILGIAFSATLGGVGTLIGTPPNMIAVKFLADQGIGISFLEWMSIGLPFVLVMLPIIWIVLSLVFRPEVNTLRVCPHKGSMTGDQKSVMLIFLFTIALWLTTEIHGISSYVIAMVPVILLYLFGLLDTNDFSKVSWPTLILLGSGLSLGSAIAISGLDGIIAASLGSAVTGLPIPVIMLSVVFLGIVLTAFASNTATASIFVPVIIPLTAALGLDLRIMTLLAAISVSLDFIVPIGTPPDTIAYSSGYIKTRDMAVAGSVITIIASLLLVMWFSVL
ncbi:MAG: DASS family sodium-coupled anion symporter [Candidatus Aenigmatarchaeota archaeon]